MVMTPSLPTTLTASAMMSPISRSPFAEMAPTWATEPSFTGFDSLPNAPPSVHLPSLSRVPMMMVTALSMPRFRAVGLAPAATVFTPSRKMAWASTVAVVVPSPATSLVLEATSFTN